MQFWIIQTLNSLALGGLLFLLSSGFSLIFGLMRIANLTHGSLFMIGAYLGVSILRFVPNLWLAALLAVGPIVAAEICGGFGVLLAVPFALVGAGEFLDTMNTVDQALLAMAGGSRVAILPTASAPWSAPTGG